MKYDVISADCHVDLIWLPPDLFTANASAGFRERMPYVTECLGKRSGPVVAASDYMKTFADQIRPFMPEDRIYRVLGTDGYGRSDSRAKLRHFFEVNRYFIAIAALKALADLGEVKPKVVADAIKKYGIDPEKPDPVTV